MTEYNKVFLDTAPVIYFLDQTPELGNTTLHIFEEIIRSNKPIITSVITVEEYLVIWFIPIAMVFLKKKKRSSISPVTWV